MTTSSVSASLAPVSSQKPDELEDLVKVTAASASNQEITDMANQVLFKTDLILARTDRVRTQTNVALVNTHLAEVAAISGKTTDDIVKESNEALKYFKKQGQKNPTQDVFYFYLLTKKDAAKDDLTDSEKQIFKILNIARNINKDTHESGRVLTEKERGDAFSALYRELDKLASLLRKIPEAEREDYESFDALFRIIELMTIRKDYRGKTFGNTLLNGFAQKNRACAEKFDRQAAYKASRVSLKTILKVGAVIGLVASQAPGPIVPSLKLDLTEADGFGYFSRPQDQAVFPGVGLNSTALTAVSRPSFTAPQRQSSWLDLSYDEDCQPGNNATDGRQFVLVAPEAAATEVEGPKKPWYVEKFKEIALSVGAVLFARILNPESFSR